MRLADLEPRWIHPNIFIFKCPCCGKMWLTAKIAAMTQKEIRAAIEAGLGEDWNETVVPPRAGAAWRIEGELPNVTVMPSIDASASGHWHGFITNGECEAVK